MVINQSQARGEGPEGTSRERSSLCESPEWKREGRGPGSAGSFALPPKECHKPKGSLQSLRSTALAENQTLFRSAGPIPATAGSRPTRRLRAGLRCLAWWGQRSFHTRPLMKHLEGHRHAWPLLKVSDPECLALGFVAAAKWELSGQRSSQHHIYKLSPYESLRGHSPRQQRQKEQRRASRRSQRPEGGQDALSSTNLP